MEPLNKIYFVLYDGSQKSDFDDKKGTYETFEKLVASL